MRTTILLFLLFAIQLYTFGQSDVKAIDVNYASLLKSVEQKIDSLKQNPDNWDKVLDLLENELKKIDSTTTQWLSNLNLDFKTFQSDDSSQTS